MSYAYLPFVSAALYGLGYVLLERLLQKTTLLTFTFTSSIFFCLVFGITAYIKRDDFSLQFLSDKKTAGLFFLTILINAIAWITTLLALKNTGAAYVSFAEISYPIFTLLFLFLIFGVNQMNWQSAIGSALIFAGSIVLVSAQLKTVNP